MQCFEADKWPISELQIIQTQIEHEEGKKNL